jgi:hypothetical protein
MSDLAKQNRKLVEEYLQAINSWDFDAMRRLLHADISYELPFAPGPFPKVTKGLDPTIEFIQSVVDFIEPENLHDISVEEYASDLASRPPTSNTATTMSSDLASRTAKSSGSPSTSTPSSWCSPWAARYRSRPDRLSIREGHRSPRRDHVVADVFIHDA